MVLVVRDTRKGSEAVIERTHLKRSIISFSNLANDQENKGIEKYGQPLDPMDDYDWLRMAQEELVDGYKYFEAERYKRDMVIRNIREILSVMDDVYAASMIENQLTRLEGKQNETG